MKKNLFTTLIFILINISFLNAQTLFWSEPGAVLKSRDLTTGIETIIFETDVNFGGNHIDYISLDTISQKIYFHLHITDPQPQQDLLMVVDYNGNNPTIIDEGFNATSMVFHHGQNRIYYTTSSGTIGDLGIRSIELTGMDELIYDCNNCFSLRLDEDDSKLYFKDGFDRKGINLDGTGLQDLSFLPPPSSNLANNNFTVDALNNDFYLSESPILGGTILIQKVNETGTQIDTILQVQSVGVSTLHIPDAPFVDVEHNKIYYDWLEDDFFSDEIKKIFKRSNIDGSNVESLDSVIYLGTNDPIDAWTIDPSVEDTPQELAIKHYHYLPNHPTFDQYTFLGSAITNSIDFQEFKVCTDGSDASIFEINYLFNEPIEQGDFILRIQEDPSGNNPEIYGTFNSIPPSSIDVITISYTHPEYIESSVNGDSIHLELVETNTGEVKETIPLALYNPPVLLIHGLNSNATVFDELREYLNYPEGFIIQPNYEATNDSEFEVNSTLLQENIDNLISEIIFSGYGVGQVDVVGHSMGGILTRLYLQSEYYLDDINKLITLNTPHSGSEMANIAYVLDIACELFSNNQVAVNEFDCFGGAIENLRTNSSAILDDLNGTNLNLNIIPSHAIVTTVNVWDYYLLEVLLGFFIFNDDHDMIVSKTSQLGGLNQLNQSEFNSPHWGSYNNPQAQTKIQDLFLANPQGVLFAQNGFSPANLNFQPPSVNAGMKAPINISSSFENQTINYDDEIDIQVTANSITDSIILMYNGLALLAPRDSSENFNSGNINIVRKIKSSELGNIPITAYSFNRTENTWGRDTFYVNITTNQTPLSFSQGIGVLHVGEKSQLPISAKFQDYSVNISGAPTIVYNFKNGLAEYTGNGYVLPLQVGIDTMTVTFNGVTSPEYRIRISDGTITNTNEVSRPTKKKRGKAFQINISPNPTRNQIAISTDVNKPMEYWVKITNSTGKTVLRKKNFELAPNNSNSISVHHLPRGIYFITLYNRLGSNTVKFIKR